MSNGVIEGIKSPILPENFSFEAMKILTCITSLKRVIIWHRGRDVRPFYTPWASNPGPTDSHQGEGLFLFSGA